MNKESNDKGSMMCLTPKPSSNFFVYRIQIKKKLFKKKRVRRIEQKRKEVFLNVPTTAIKKDPKMSIKKHANALKVNEKTMGTVIKQDSSLDLKSLDYAIWGRFRK